MKDCAILITKQAEKPLIFDFENIDTADKFADMAQLSKDTIATIVIDNTGYIFSTYQKDT